MNKDHSCIKNIKENLSSNKTISNIEIHLTNIQNIEERGLIKTGQKLSYTQEITLKNGEKRYKKVNTFLTHVYCPFCGEKYEEEKNYIYFKMTKSQQEIDRVCFEGRVDMSNKEINQYFEESCGGVYKWSKNKEDLL